MGLTGLTVQVDRPGYPTVRDDSDFGGDEILNIEASNGILLA
jgi:hypothetical protein